MKSAIKKLVLAALDQELRKLTVPFSRQSKASTANRFIGTVKDLDFILEIIFSSANDGFTADLVWSKTSELQMIPDFVDRAEARGQPSGAIRITFLWAERDDWWHIKPPPPPITTRRSAADIFRQASNRITPEIAMSQIPTLIAEFAEKIEDSVIPFMKQIVE